MLILPSHQRHVLPYNLFYSDFPNKIWISFLQLRRPRPCHPPWLDTFFLQVVQIMKLHIIIPTALKLLFASCVKILFSMPCQLSFLGTSAKLRKTTVCFVMSVSPSAWNNSVSDGQILMKLILEGFSILSREFMFHQNLTRITDTLCNDLCAVVIQCRCILLRMINVSDKSCSENQNNFYVQHYLTKQ
jgi:hypothetical protein